MSTKPVCIGTVERFLRSCCVETLTPTILSHSLKARRDHCFDTSSIVLTGHESSQVCIKLISCTQSCRHGLTHWVRVKFARTYSFNRYTNNRRLRMWVSWKTTLRLNTFDGPPAPYLHEHLKANIVRFFCRDNVSNGRMVQTNVGQFRYCTSKLDHTKAFVVMKIHRLLHSLQCCNVFQNIFFD